MTSFNLPYHLRSLRLRWATLAIDLDSSEVASLRQLATEPHYSPREQLQARLLLGLHQRVPIHDLCERLDIDRRTLFKMASELIEKRAKVHRYRAGTHAAVA